MASDVFLKLEELAGSAVGRSPKDPTHPNSLALPAVGLIGMFGPNSKPLRLTLDLGPLNRSQLGGWGKKSHSPESCHIPFPATGSARQEAAKS